MKLFGAKRDPNDPPGLFQSRWFRALVTFCSVLVIVAVCVEIYRRAANYGTRLVEDHPVDARIVIQNPPAWLHRDIVAQLLKESYEFAQKDDVTYNRARNILDNDILHEIANLYTGTEKVNGKTVSRQSRGFNAWIRRIDQVRRNIAPDRKSQTIEIYAQWRSPAAWVKANDMLYLVDAEGVRLPGDYPLSDRSASKLMVIAGVDLPEVDGTAAVPRPGQPWTAGRTMRLGDDLLAGMKLVGLLKEQQFAGQIDAIDMTNFNGRRDARAPWILLDTIWKTADGAPTVVQWGRPAGAETFYEIHAEAKLKLLNDVYLRFSRIDAGHDYIDIRDEVLRLPKVASQGDQPQSSTAAAGGPAGRG